MPPKTKKASLKQENEVAAANNGTVNPGSGNGWRHKNDVRSADYSFECKTTTKRQFSLKLAELETANLYAVMDGKNMAFVIDIDGRRYYVVQHHLWQEISQGWPLTDFNHYAYTTAAASLTLKRDSLDESEKLALAVKNDPVWLLEIRAEVFMMVRDYTWHMLRGD